MLANLSRMLYDASAMQKECETNGYSRESLIAAPLSLVATQDIGTTDCAHDIREPISFRTWKNLNGHVIEWQRKTRCLSCGVRVVEEWGR